MSLDILFGIYIFVLALFAGYGLIAKVPPILHTPLMSGANAISGISVLGGLLVTQPREVSLITVLGMVAVIFGMINVVGGFLVTDRMLRMFRRGLRRER